MPGFDGTGPGGQGALTGGGRGRCAGNTETTDLAPMWRGSGRGMGGRGLGRGRGNCFRSLKGSGEEASVRLAELQLKCDQLQADIAVLKEKNRQA